MAPSCRLNRRSRYGGGIVAWSRSLGCASAGKRKRHQAQARSLARKSSHVVVVIRKRQVERIQDEGPQMRAGVVAAHPREKGEAGARSLLRRDDRVRRSPGPRHTWRRADVR